MPIMKYIGLFAVVYAAMTITKAVGLDVDGQIIGAVIGAGTYVLTFTDT